MLKADLRKKYMDHRKTFSEEEVQHLSEKLFARFVEDFSIAPPQKVHLFLSIKRLNEVETRFFLDYFWKNKIQVFVPKIQNGKIISLPYTSDTLLEINSWGIPEPVVEEDASAAFDYVFTPTLYCDGKGNRIGYGKGFYDAFFTGQGKNAVKIGLNFFGPKEEIDDVLETDVRLDYLISPTETLSFGKTSISTK